MPPENVADVKAMAALSGVQAQVMLHDLVRREEVVSLQQRSDILLLLRWDNPEENGVLAGKLFEYIGSVRPILSLGSITGEAADILRKHGLGLVTNDVDEVAAQLKKWLKLKKQGGVPAPRKSDLEIFSRPHQFRELDKFLKSCLGVSRK
jgi:glycosyltransferase involved in cell wall biosynthesis